MNPFRSERKTLLSLFVFMCAGAIGAFLWANSPSNDFPSGKIVTIERGNTASDVVQMLKDEHIIRSREFALLVGKIYGTTNTIIAGEYQFAEPLSTVEVINRIGVGRFGIVRERVTLLEGWTNREYAKALEQKLPLFDSTEFLAAVSDNQGYLFPDTYFFKRTETTAGVIEKIKENFEQRTKDLPAATGRARNRTMDDIINMASILEREATDFQDARMISDILWSRLDAGMPLQVDATLKYSTGRGSAELTITDLRTDSAYNTYTRRGLPPTAIGNPGLEMIRAALTPSPNDYVYYLHGNDGVPYYAKTFAEHVQNKKLYLK